MASGARIAALKVLDRNGAGAAADVLAGIRWLIANREKYGVRVANLSIGTPDAGSNDPLVRAVEAAWDAGIVVVIAAGNDGPDLSTVTSPGVSRKAVTVGVSDGAGADISGRGPTLDCVVKPDVVAPGTDIVSCFASRPYLSRKRLSELRFTGGDAGYVVMSGTSMAAPFVSGAVALLLEKHPELTPDDVKYALKRCARPILGVPKNRQGWGLVDVERLISQEAWYVRGQRFT